MDRGWAAHLLPLPRGREPASLRSQLWADGKVTAAFGRLEQEGKGGSYQIVAMDLQPEQAKNVF